MRWIQLVPVTQEDEAFLREVFFTIKKDEFAILGWSEDQLNPLLMMQYVAQQNSYKAQYPDAEYRMIRVKGIRAGRIITSTKASHLALIDISLLPDFRQQGIGTEVLTLLQAAAAKQGQAIKLHVLNSNTAARRLYERLGFHSVGTGDPYVAMEWKA